MPVGSERFQHTNLCFGRALLIVFHYVVLVWPDSGLGFTASRLFLILFCDASCVTYFFICPINSSTE